MHWPTIACRSSSSPLSFCCALPLHGPIQRETLRTEVGCSGADHHTSQLYSTIHRLGKWWTHYCCMRGNTWWWSIGLETLYLACTPVECNNVRTHSGSSPLHAPFNWHTLVLSPSSSKPRSHVYSTTEPLVVEKRNLTPSSGVPGSPQSIILSVAVHV